MDTNIVTKAMAVIDVGISVAIIEAKDVEPESFESYQIREQGIVWKAFRLKDSWLDGGVMKLNKQIACFNLDRLDMKAMNRNNPSTKEGSSRSKHPSKSHMARHYVGKACSE